MVAVPIDSMIFKSNISCIMNKVIGGKTPLTPIHSSTVY